MLTALAIAGAVVLVFLVLFVIGAAKLNSQASRNEEVYDRQHDLYLEAVEQYANTQKV